MSEGFTPGDLVRLRGREWVVLGEKGGEVLHVRPLSGSEKDALRVDTSLEPPEPARFEPPDTSEIGTQAEAQLLADAARLSLRRGAGPIRSAAHLGVEPRAYQLVPLMLALRQLPRTVRLLVADDVGIGKTVEAGMILRELLDRGEIERFCVLCPPHLVQQWTGELAEKFDIDAVAVTSAHAARLERGLPVGKSLFEVHPFTVVSLDYIKSARRNADFVRACPKCVVVDEAHACVGATQSGARQQRYDLLHKLSGDASRHLLLLTATPHSGDRDAFDRLVGLLSDDLGAGVPDTSDQNGRERYFRLLARHYVQRRRPDIEAREWNRDSARTFPFHHEREATYTLSGRYDELQGRTLDYCLEQLQRANGQSRRLAYWSTLALMRCVGSSPAAAATALKNRLNNGVFNPADLEAIEGAVFDEEDGLAADSDVEPNTQLQTSSLKDDPQLPALIDLADNLRDRPRNDPKIQRLCAELEALAELGAQPVIFCRFIATAKYVGAYLKARFTSHAVEVVTGELTPEERKARINDMPDDAPRILVATDCLSEGINLQDRFSAVLHYDLSWNPTRHQQREGRVNRFGQTAENVYTVMLYGDNSAIDGAVLKVVLRKAEAIRKATGVTVPLPENTDTISSALMQAVSLRSTAAREQLSLDFGSGDPAAEAERAWRNAEDAARASKSRYAQTTLRPEDVIPERDAIRALGGGPEEVERFTRRALARLGAPLGERPDGTFRLNVDELPPSLAEALAIRGVSARRPIHFEDRLHEGATYVGRVHPVTSLLARTLAESALDPDNADVEAPLRRTAVWVTRAVRRPTTVLLLRLRYTLAPRNRQGRLLLAEEISALAFGPGEITPLRSHTEALALLETTAVGNIAPPARARLLAGAAERLPEFGDALNAHAQARAAILGDDHDRLTDASGGGASVEVAPALPPDILGVYLLLPEVEL